MQIEIGKVQREKRGSDLLKAFYWMNFREQLPAIEVNFSNRLLMVITFTYYSFDTMQSFSCQFIILISTFTGVFICLLIRLLASLLVCCYFFSLILNSWWMPSFHFGSPICMLVLLRVPPATACKRITKHRHTQLCWLYALKFLVDWTVHTHSTHAMHMHTLYAHASREICRRMWLIFIRSLY